MKILFVSNLYPPHFLGGYELLCRDVAEFLSRKNHEVNVLTSTHGYTQLCDQVINGIKVFRRLHLEQPFDQKPVFSLRRRWTTARHNSRETAQAIREMAPDVIMLWSQLRLTLGAAEAVERSAAPHLWTFNDANILAYRDSALSPRFRSKVRSLLCRHVLPGSSPRRVSFQHSTVISHVLKDDLLEGGLPVEEAVVIHQGINPMLFPERETPILPADQPVRICYTGQLHPYKGVHVAVEAVQRFAKEQDGHPPILTIIGDGPADYTESLHQLASDGPARVEFVGRVPREELGSLLRTHDIFLFPSSWREPFGLTHLEAMASGLLVISTTEGGQREFLRDGENCLTFPKEDASALADHLRRAVADPEQARIMARHGSSEARTNFTLERYAAQIEGMIEACRKEPTPCG